jgi:hypothetical protein
VSLDVNRRAIAETVHPEPVPDAATSFQTDRMTVNYDLGYPSGPFVTKTEVRARVLGRAVQCQSNSTSRLELTSMTSVAATARADYSPSLVANWKILQQLIFNEQEWL